MIKKSSLLFLICMLFTGTMTGQGDSLKRWQFSAFGDFYYTLDLTQPKTNRKPDFLYNHKRNYEINANLLFGKVAYQNSGTRINLAIMGGTYAQYNLAHEPAWAQFILEANAAFRLSKKHALWMEIGIFPSHIGFESAVSRDCWTVTRSIVAENSPYYEAGLNLGYTTPDKKMTTALYLLNGWQTIQKPDNITLPSFGFMAKYSFLPDLFLQYSFFTGQVLSFEKIKWRTYHNVFAQIISSGRLGVIAGFDTGWQYHQKKFQGILWAPVVIVKYDLNATSGMAFRCEWYDDSDEIMVATSSGNGFSVGGLSLNFDKKLNEILKSRIEARWLQAQNKSVFQNGQDHLSLTFNLTFQLQ